MPDGVKRRTDKLTLDDAREIRRRAAAGEPRADIADAFGVNKSQVARIVNNQAFREPEPEPEPAGQTTSAGLEDIPWAAIEPWDMNPRKTFDADALRELAANIGREGVLQNLVVRPHPEAEGRFQLVAGERRWRAVEILIREGLWDRDTTTVPCRVSHLPDAEALEVAITENMERADVPPMEEARAFAALLDLRRAEEPELSTRHFAGVTADRLGVSGRHVELRLDLVAKCTPGVQAALEAGEISLAMARKFARMPAGLQDDLLPNARGGMIRTADQLWDVAMNRSHPVGANRFPLEAYTGDFIEDPDDPDKRWFANPGEFQRLQREAADELARKAWAEDGWQFAEIYSSPEGQYWNRWSQGWTECDDKSKAGVVIEIRHDWTLAVHEGWMRRTKAPAAGGAPAGHDGEAAAQPKEPATQAHYLHARRRKSAALQDAVSAHPHMAKALLCLSLLGAHGVLCLETTSRQADDAALGALTAGDLRRWAEALPGLEVTDRLRLPRADGHNQAAHARLLTDLCGLSGGDLDDLLASLTAALFGSFNSYDAKAGDDPVPLTVSRVLDLAGNEADHGLAVTDEDLAGLRKETLLDVLMATGTATDQDRGEWGRDKTAELRQAALTSGAAANHVLPTLRFRAPDDLPAWDDPANAVRTEAEAAGPQALASTTTICRLGGEE